MTAILQEIRRLDAARQRGEISSTEFAFAKAELLNAVEDADVATSPNTRPVRRARPKASNAAANSALVPILLICVAGMGAMTLLANLVIGDLTLAMTLTATLFAAVVIAAFRKLEE